MKKHKIRVRNGEYRADRKLFRLIKSKRPKLYKNNWRKMHGYPKLSHVHLCYMARMLAIRKDYHDLIKKGIYRV